MTFCVTLFIILTYKEAVHKAQFYSNHARHLKISVDVFVKRTGSEEKFLLRN